MAEQGRVSHCPDCGKAVVYRLGRAECEHCGFVGDDAFSKAMPQPERQGFQSWQSGQPPQAAPPPGAPGSYGGQQYGAVRQPTYEDPLRTEKWAFIWSVVAVVILMMSMTINFYATDGMANGNAIAGELGGMIVGLGAFVGLLIAVVRFAVFYYVFFGAEIWAKWTCLGCNGCSLLGLLPLIFMPQAGLPGDSNSNFPSGVEVYGRYPWLGIIDAGMACWLIYLLHRDIQNRQNYA